MKAPASFLGSFLVVAIRSRSFPNPTTAISSINLSKRSSQRLLCLCCDNTFCTLMSRKTPSKLSDSVPFSARRAFMSQDSGEMKQPTLYEVLVRKLYMTNMFNPVKLGLKNMEDLHNLLNKPMDRDNLLIVHVAGTNGKGSVCYKIAKTFQLAGYRTGLYTRERIQVNSVPISEKEVTDHFPNIFSLVENNQIPATFFEITTALAFSYFNASDVDVVVLETGLGGRLDSTNIIQRPTLSIITSIGLDHTKILGETIELIAKEKAGIIKNHCPVLVGPNVPHHVVRPIAQSKQSEYYVSDKGFHEITDEFQVGSSEIQDFDLENTRIAQAAFHLLRNTSIRGKTLYVSDQNIAEGTSIRPPCRFEVFHIRHQNKNDVTVILDIAHNPPALKLLIYKLHRTFPDKKFRFVVGISSDKDIMEFGNVLVSRGLKSNATEQIHLVEAASNPRAATIEKVFLACPSLRDVTYSGCDEDKSLHAQLQSALTLASAREEIVVVCGTVFIMSEVRQALGLDEPCDSKYITSAFGFNYTNIQENFADPMSSAN